MYRANLNHPVIVVERGNAVDLVQRVWTDFTVRRVRRRSIGMTEEANVSGNALDMPTSVWSEMTRKQVEPLIYRTANDGQRQLADASGRTALEQYGLRLPANYRQAVRKRAAGQ